MEDILVKGTIEGVRIYALCTTQLVQELNVIHACSPLAIAALGRAASGALLMAATMKNDERITLRFSGDGPLGEVVADAKGNCVRGYVDNPEVCLPVKKGKLDVGGGIGAGNIIVTRYLTNAEPFNGYCELVNGEIAADLTNYLYKSEQIPSSVALGVLVGSDGEVKAAGGYFIQAMPDSDDSVLAQLENTIITLPYVTELLEAGNTPEEIIARIGQGLKVHINEKIPVKLQCTCTREKVKDMLAALPTKDLQEIGQDEIIEVNCHFCNKSYKFKNTELQAMEKEKTYKSLD
ncbi:MAG: Hsp33 family molecular chaperone HslO [Acidaminococcaceae bacterium]